MPLSVLRTGVRLLRPHAAAVSLLALACSASAILTSVLDPLLQRASLDSLAQRRMPAFLVAAVLLVLAGTASRLLSYLSATRTQRLKGDIGQRLADESAKHFLGSSFDDVSRRDTSYHVTRLVDDPTKISTELVDGVATLATAGVTIVGAATVALWLSWRVALVVSVATPILIILSRRATRAISRSTHRASEHEAVLKGTTGRLVEGFKTIVLFHLESSSLRTTRRHACDYFAALSSRAQSTARYQAVSGVLLTYAELVVMVGAGIQVIRGQLTIGGVFGFMTAYWRVIGGINSLIALTPLIARLQGLLERHQSFLASAGRRGGDAQTKAPTLTNVWFRYGDGDWVVRDLTLAVVPGSRVLLIGANGSGKSTVAHLLAGFLLPARGSLEHPPVARTSAQLLPFGFAPGSLRDHLALDGLSDAERARTLHFIDTFGMLNELDRDPVTLSQGQQRKAQIALVLGKIADVYIFDEPLSHIDNEGKALIMDTILHHTTGKTLLMILHGDEGYWSRFDTVCTIGSPLVPEPEIPDRSATALPMSALPR